MQENRVSIKISADDLQKAKEAVATLSTILGPHLIALTPEERKRLPKMSDGTLPFVQKALDYATTNAAFVPAYIDVNELRIDVDATDTLLEIERPLEQLAQNLSDTIMLCGSEAYVTALSFYSNVRQAAKTKVQGAEPVANDLSIRFAKTTAKPVKTEATQ